MAKKERTDKELSAILAKAVSQAEHISDGKLSEERTTVGEYYRGEKPEPLHSGDSKYVSRDVFDSVDSMRSDLLEAFMANTRMVYFRPEDGETVEAAKQATEYCRHVFFKENSGEDILYDTVTDALTNRYSVTKVYHDEASEEEVYEFEGLTPEELTAEVMDHPNFEFTETTVSENGLYSGEFKVALNQSKVKVEVVQPEDFMVSSHTSDISEAKYIIHRLTKSKSDLLKEGYDKKKVDKLKFSSDYDMDHNWEKNLRFEPVGDVTVDDQGHVPAEDTITLYEIYMMIDMEDDGITRLWKFDYSGGIILSKERVSKAPFVSYVPLPVPHTFYGENFAKSVIPIQNARTVLIRQIINHSLATNNPRQMVLNGTVQNPNEILENRAGGIVNVRRMDGIAPIPQAPLNSFIFNLIGMLDEDKEEVTGISKLSQGLNKDAISTQNSEAMVNDLVALSKQRQKIMARRFGLYLRNLWHLIYQTAIDYIDYETIIEVSGVAVVVNPSDWKSRRLASIELALGPSDAEKEAIKWEMMDMKFSQDPQLAPAYSYDKRYEVISRSAEKRGIEDIRSILTPPEELQPPEPSEAEKLQLEQLRSQIELQKAQAQSMITKGEVDRMNAQAKLIEAQTKAQQAGAKIELENAQFAHDVDMDIQEMEQAKKVHEDQQSAVYHPE